MDYKDQAHQAMEHFVSSWKDKGVRMEYFVRENRSYGFSQMPLLGGSEVIKYEVKVTIQLRDQAEFPLYKAVTEKALDEEEGFMDSYLSIMQYIWKIGVQTAYQSVIEAMRKEKVSQNCSEKIYKLYPLTPKEAFKEEL